MAPIVCFGERTVVSGGRICVTISRSPTPIIESCAGKFPLWLAPVQVVVATITNDSDAYARTVVEALKSKGLRVEADLDSQKINYKIREHSLKKVPYILAIGKKEAEGTTVSVRKFGEENQTVMALQEFVEMVQEQVRSKS